MECCFHHCSNWRSQQCRFGSFRLDRWIDNFHIFLRQIYVRSLLPFSHVFLTLDQAGAFRQFHDQFKSFSGVSCHFCVEYDNYPFFHSGFLFRMVLRPSTANCRNSKWRISSRGITSPVVYNSQVLPKNDP